jgi:hypothetical protein
MHPIHIRACWLLILVPLFIGCHRAPPIEKERTAAKGTVTLDGKPLPGGTITFRSVKDTMFRATVVIQPDGTFLVADAPEGPVTVAIETESVLALAPPLGPNDPKPKAYVPIPAKYADEKTSGLSATVARGEDAPPLSFDLKSK